MVKYCVLGSGSNGNGYAISYNGETILIDNGFSRVELMRRFERAGLDFSSISAVFVTHLHPDHCLGLGVLARKDKLSIYVNNITLENCKTEYAKLGIPSECLKAFDINQVLEIGAFSITSFRTSHDSAGSVGYAIKVAEKKFCLVTDTGVFSPAMVNFASKSNVLFLESNYNEEMLANSPYPYRLKKRIAGERGHLSNTQATEFLTSCNAICSKGGVISLEEKSPLEKVYFIHLSKVNNNAQQLMQKYDKMLMVCENGKLVQGNI